MIHKQQMFTGGAKDKCVLRILPALNIDKSTIDRFFRALQQELTNDTITL